MKEILTFDREIKGRNFNGNRLMTARLWRNLSTLELADAAGFSRQTISMLENGKLLNPEYSTVQKLSMVLDFPVTFFLEKEKVLINNSPTYFRSLLTTNKKYRVEQEEKIKFVSIVYTMLNEYLDFKPLNMPDVPAGTSPQEAAKLLRTRWNLGNRPIENLVYHAEKNGLVVMDFETSTDDVDAFSHKIGTDEFGTFLLGYSKNKNTASRIHFDIAHELGHVMLHGWYEDLDKLDKEEFKAIEQEAHTFASAFLLPEETFAKEVEPYATNLSYYVELKKRWKVSIAAMIRRAKDLDIISQDDYSRLMRSMQKQGIRKTEPLDRNLVTSEPSLIRQAVRILLDNNVFSANEFVHELSQEYGLTLYPKELESLLGLETGTLVEEDNPKVVLSIKTQL